MANYFKLSNEMTNILKDISLNGCGCIDKKMIDNSLIRFDELVRVYEREGVSERKCLDISLNFHDLFFNLVDVLAYAKVLKETGISNAKLSDWVSSVLTY